VQQSSVSISNDKQKGERGKNRTGASSASAATITDYSLAAFTADPAASKAASCLAGCANAACWMVRQIEKGQISKTREGACVPQLRSSVFFHPLETANRP
jgi:hypothetical protein